VKKIVIRFGDGLQGVKCLGNPPYPVNSLEFYGILYFFATFVGKRGLSSMQHDYVRELTSMQHTCLHGLLVQQVMYTLQKMVF
jgi:hypothetical protein